MILGITVDGPHARGVLVDAEGAVVARSESKSGEHDALVEVAREMLAAAQGAAPAAVAVSFPDPDSKNWPPDLSFLSAALGRTIPIKLLSTGNAAALAEMWYGAGRAARDLIAFSIGPSVSAGIVSHGSVLAGAHGLAGSVAWLALNPVEREDYRRLGCLEAESGSAGIVRRLIWRIKSGDESRVLDMASGDYAKIQLDDIFEAARGGDGVAISVIRDTVRYLAMAVSNVAAVIDPEVIVLGGVFQSAEDLMLEPVRQECVRRMPPAMQERTVVGLSKLGSDAAPMGAARFAVTGTRLP